MIRIGHVLVCLVATVLVAACGTQSQEAEPPDASADLVSIEEAGTGKTQREEWGSETRPLTWEMVGVNDGPLGSMEPFRKGWGSDVCSAVKGFKDFTRNGVSGRAAEVWLYPEREKFTLICSAPSAPIWGNTTGPGPNGLSVACPEWAPHVDQRTRGLYMVDSRGVNMRNFVTQSSGGYGSNGDGLWNYKFHNWSTSELRPTIWALCR